MIQLPDGRRLAFATHGDPDGWPLFYCHGGGSSRLEGAWLHAAGQRQGVRVITPDRPGFGFSTFQPGRQLRNWAADVAVLADNLQIDTFGIAGLSGGGPHALAVAHMLPQRVRGCAVISGVAPPEMAGRHKGMFPPLYLNYWMAQHWPAGNRFFLKQTGKSYQDPLKFGRQVKLGMAAEDGRLARKAPERIAQFCAAAVEGQRQGIDGDAHEWQLYVQPWGFKLGAICVPVDLWYGDADTFVPLRNGRYLADHIPHSHLHIIPDGGHFSTLINSSDAILAALKACATQQSQIQAA